MANKSSSKAGVKKRLNDLHTNLKTWSKVSENLSKGQPKKIDRAMLCRIAKGEQRASNAVLIALGLPPRMEMAAVCPVHGVVHIGRCPRKSPETYDAWRARNTAKLKEIVAWAEQRQGQL